MEYFKPLILPILILSIWIAVSYNGIVSEYLIPSPAKVLSAAVDLYKRDILQKHIATSMWRVITGFSIAISIAIPLAILLYWSRRIEKYLSFMLEFIRSTPPLALVPLLILWLGIGEALKITIIILATFFPLFLNTLSGLKNVDKKLIEMANTIELTKWEKLLFVLIPGSLPSIVTGLRLGFGYSWRALIGAELIAASAGLGYMILDAEALAQTDVVFVGIVVIGTFGYLFDLIFRRIINYFFFYMNIGEQL
ncbi:MAG: ABC transporter permease [Desulfobacterales bacterium]|nr:ABC transporter permease [Desulfobacterales bacterium]